MVEAKTVFRVWHNELKVFQRNTLEANERRTRLGSIEKETEEKIDMVMAGQKRRMLGKKGF